ncbi:MAG: replicative DNA helicase [Actinobacteria bacterium]|nr:replicative DNA helicase [Actinomycetota bacterium]MBU4302425.1 replicative DNA helicase [Actinomycetota bacterium]MBU4385577.1 replicative DNA helicase [Actinomycetota bacterium]MBU4490114.1 replicative DNA helicase [Actinomycetota bacterium]
MAGEPPTRQDRVPPHNLEAEESVLGSMILSHRAAAEAQELLVADDFYTDAHRKIYGTLVELYAGGSTTDPVVLAEELKKRGTLESVGDRAYIYSLVDYTPNPHNVKHYARIVRDMAFKRSLIEVGYEVTSLGYSTANGVEEAFDKSESAIFGVGKRMRRERLTHINEPLKESFQRMEKARKQGSAITGVETGFERLDKLTSGLQPSNLIVVGGRTAMGKTSFALNIAHHASVRRGLGVLIFSMEMSKVDISERLLCTQAKVSSTDYRIGKISDERFVDIVDATGVLSNAPIFIDDTGDLTMTQMRSKSRQLMSKEDIGLIILDYIQLMHIPGFREGRVQEVSRIARDLKVMAMELEIPVIAASQLRRSSQSVGKKEPNLEDLRESGAIEQNADLVVLIYRREVDEPRNLDCRGVAEINLAKHRNGEGGKFKLAWIGEHTQFANLSAEEEAFPS